jgi:hypothetical protein
MKPVLLVLILLLLPVPAGAAPKLPPLAAVIMMGSGDGHAHPKYRPYYCRAWRRTGYGCGRH